MGVSVTLWVTVRLQAGRGEWVTEDSCTETESSREPLSTW